MENGWEGMEGIGANGIGEGRRKKGSANAADRSESVGALDWVWARCAAGRGGRGSQGARNVLSDPVIEDPTSMLKRLAAAYVLGLVYSWDLPPAADRAGKRKISSGHRTSVPSSSLAPRLTPS